MAKQTLEPGAAGMGYRKLSARPRHHAQAEGAVEDLKSFPAHLDEIAREKGVAADRIEVWFADEARIGQKNKITWRWARRGTRPSAPYDQRTASTYIFGAICPSEGKGACPGPAGLQHRSHEPAPGRDRNRGGAGAHAVLLIDRAGWHLASRLVVPPNITLVALPPKCPEPTPSRTSGSSCAITGSRTASSRPTTISSTHCCDAWNKLTQSAVDHHVHRPP